MWFESNNRQSHTTQIHPKPLNLCNISFIVLIIEQESIKIFYLSFSLAKYLQYVRDQKSENKWGYLLVFGKIYRVFQKKVDPRNAASFLVCEDSKRFFIFSKAFGQSGHFEYNYFKQLLILIKELCMVRVYITETHIFSYL